MVNRNRDGSANYDAALIQLFPAVDATAQKLYPTLRGSRHCRARIVRFVDENTRLITKFTFLGTSFGKAFFEFRHPEIKHPEKSGMATLGEICYLIRSSLVHTGEIDLSIIWTDDRCLRVNHGQDITLPKTLVEGLLAAVISSPVNAAEKFRRNYSLRIGTAVLRFEDRLWGNESFFESFADEAKKAINTSPT
jgi:hypothetical protein